MSARESQDPKHFPEMSPFKSEMRRRVWLFLAQADPLISFQFGIPRNIDPSSYDTELPRNLYDEDFDEDCVELPPSRPENDRTIVLYSIAKSRVVQAFGDIVAIVTSQDLQPWLIEVEVVQYLVDYVRLANGLHEKVHS